MKVIYLIRYCMFAVLYRVHAIYVDDVRDRARLHPERKADENALAVNNVGRVSKARTRAYKEIKSTWPRSIPPAAFSASCRPRLDSGDEMETLPFPIGKGDNH